MLRIPFEDRPDDFIPITDWEKPHEIQFAIDQLELSRKAYSVATRADGKIRLWTAQPRHSMSRVKPTSFPAIEPD